MNVWNFLKEMENLQNQLSQVSREFGFGKRAPLAFLPGLSSRIYPLVNTWADEENLFIEAVVPGIESSSLKVNALKNQLSISGEKSPSGIPAESFHRCERGEGKFSRTFELPLEINPEKVSAEYKNGILTIKLAKAEESKPHQIQVKVN